MDENMEYRQSLWLQGRKAQHFPKLEQDCKVDVLVVGGGLAGLNCAWELHKAGVKVAVLEAVRLGGGTSARTTGKITSQHELLYGSLETQYGRALAQQAAMANESAISAIAGVVEGLNIDCDFQRESAYVFTQSEGFVNKIEREDQLAQEFGIRSALVQEIPLPLPVLTAVRFENQAQFHPIRYMDALAAELARQGVQIYEHSRAVALDWDGRYTVTTEGGKKAVAERVILATHYPFVNKPALFFTRLYVERSYLMAVKMKEPFPGGMYINAEEPVRSLRGAGDLLLVGGENHRTGQAVDTEARYGALEEFARTNFTVQDIPLRWSAEDCMTMDGLPYIGEFSPEYPGLYVATGFNKWGMTGTMVSALVLSGLIIRGENDWADAFSPARGSSASAIGTFIVENTITGVELVKGKLPAKEEGPAADDMGRVIVDENGKRLGVCRDEQGKLHVVDLTCPHMGCELQWNRAERSWDCPCHGSRFTMDGAILDGPAVHELGTIEVSTIKKLLTERF